MKRSVFIGFIMAAVTLSFMFAQPNIAQGAPVVSPSDIQNAIDTAAPGDTIELQGNMALDAALIVSKSLTFKATTTTPITLTSQQTSRHMEITGTNIKVSFEGVILAGNEVSGGIRLSGTDITLGNAYLTHCYSASIKTSDETGYLDAGGAVYVDVDSSVSIEGGSYLYNKAVGAGGALFAQNNTSISITNDPVFSYNQATLDQLRSSPGSSFYTFSYGGAVCGFGSESNITLTGGTYSFNSAGNITPGGQSTGPATASGGAVFSHGAIIVTGASIVFNTAGSPTIQSSSFGGGIAGKWVTLNSGEVSDNLATGNAQSSTNGGGIASRATSSTQSPSGNYVLNLTDTSYGVIINGGIVARNQATGGASASGGGIETSRLIMQGGIVSENSAANAAAGSRGGGIAVTRPFGWFEMVGGEVSGNSAQFGGGLYFDCPTNHSDGGVYGICTISGTSLIQQNTATTVAGGVAYYNEVPSIDFYPVISGSARIIDNKAPSSGGILMFTGASGNAYFPQIHLSIEEDALVEGNEATTGYGGGVVAHIQRSGATSPNSLGEGFTLTIKDNARISNNSAATFAGGIMAFYAKVFLLGSAQVDGNEAGTYAGGIFINQSSLDTLGDVKITGNTATTIGGGLVFNSPNSTYANQSHLALSGATRIEGNSALGAGGGGIYVTRADWPRVTMGEDVVCGDNYAVTPYLMTNLADIQEHDSYIHAAQFTKPFLHAYNNNDIYYLEGLPLTYCTVSFETGGYTPVPESLYTVISGSSLEAPLVTPGRLQYRFTGWYKDPESTQPWDFAVDTVLENTILYAGWEEAAAEVVPPVDLPAANDSGVISTAETIPAAGDTNGALVLAVAAMLVAGFVFASTSRLRAYRKRR